MEIRAGWARGFEYVQIRPPTSPRQRAERRRGRPARFVLAASALAVCLVAPVGLKAATLTSTGVAFTVTSTADADDASPGNGACATSSGACTLRAAIQETNGLAGADTIVLPAGTYELAIPPLNQNLANVGDLDVTDSLTITGAGAGATFVDGGTPTPGSPPQVHGLDRLFEVSADDATVVLSDLTLREGWAAEYGGAIMSSSLATVRVIDSVLAGNGAGKAGGAIDNHFAGTVEVQGSTLRDNYAAEAGSALNNNRGGTMTIADSVVTSNSAADAGLDEVLLGAGAIANNAELDAIGALSIRDSEITENRAGGGRSGAGVSNDGAGTVVVTDTIFRGNQAMADGGAIFNLDGPLTVTRGTFTDNAGSNGGAISSSGQGLLTVVDSTFTKNVAGDWGGGIQNGNKGSVTIRSSAFIENTGLNGGGFGNEGSGLVTVEGSTFTKNAALDTATAVGGEGGGMHSNSGGEVVITGGSFVDNHALGGGGLSNEGGGQVSVTGTRFSGNRADEAGGGILIQSGDVRMVDIDVVGNLSDSLLEGGGGISYAGDKVVSVGETAAIEGSRIRNNTAKGQGGGVDSRGDGPLVVATTTISGNSAAIGGAIHHVGDAPLEVARSTLSGNSAENGGGLFTDGDGETSVVNSTVSGNRAGQFGGGLLVSSRLVLRSSTVSANVAPAGGGINNGGGDLAGDGSVFLANTIVSGNTGGNCAGTMTSQGGNVEGSNTCQLVALSDQPGTDPRLGPLAANGGPTDTHALLQGSPAQDKAACTDTDPCPAVDQRGVARPAFGGYDAGAFESSLEPAGGVGGGPCTGRTERPVPSNGDSWVSQAAATSNFGGDSTLKVASQAGGNQRALVHFELPAIPPGCKLVGATLRLYSPSAVDGRTLDVLRVTSPWSESAVTWSTQPATAGAASGTESGLDAREWDVLAQTLDLYNLGGHGFLLRDRSEGGSSALQSFHSREKGADRPPELVLVFDDPEGASAGGECGSTPLRISADRDSWVSESSPTNNFGTDSTLKVKSQVGSNSRVFIRFPLPDIGGGCTSVASATLKLEATSAKEGRMLVVRPAGGAWTESGVTWGNQPAGSGPARAIPSFDGPLEWDVTAGVLQMYVSANNGFVIRDSAENGVGDEQTINSRHKITDVAPELLLVFDSATPETTIGLAPLSPTEASWATFAFESDGEDATFECALDGGSYQACESPKSYAGLAEGAHSFSVRAKRPVRAVDPTPASHAWTISIPPETVLDGGPSALTNDATPEFSFSSEPGTTFECALDGGAFAECSSPYSTPSLIEGAHTFEVRAVDSLGNADPTPAGRGFTVDTSAPETTIDSGPEGPTSEPSAVLAFSATDAASFECALDADAFASCTSPVSLGELADGAHTFQVRASDSAGSVDSSPAIRSWTVDTTAPETSIDSGPNALTNDSTPELTFSSEAGATFECSLDSGAFTACESPYSAAMLADGDHTFAVRAIDAVGNTDDTPAARSFSVDTLAPQTAIAGGPDGITSDDTPTFELSSGDESATFECRVDADAFAACSSPHTTGTLTDGAHVFEARATDAAGNSDATPASRTFTVDTAAPETTIDSGPSRLTSSTTATLGFSSTEAGAFECAIDAGAFASCTSPVSLNGLADGPHTFQVRASDAAGNLDSSPASRSWTVDTTAPETSIDSGPNALTNDSTPELTFSSEAGASFECSLDAAAFASCGSPYATPALADGGHAFAVRAIDAAGNADETPAAGTFTVDTASPETMLVSGPSALTMDSTPAFEFASETGATFKCSLDAGAFTSCASPLTAAELADGRHTFEVRAVDAAGNADATPAGLDFTVDTSAPETTIDSGIEGVTSSTSASFLFSASEAATFECALDSGNFATCTSPQGYSDLGDGPHTFRVRAIDAAGNGDASPASRSWTVDTAAPETTIDSGPSDSTSSASASFGFSASETASFECALDAGDFAACTSAQGYAGLGDGSHTFRVRATDAAGNVDATPASRTWTIDSTEPQTTIDSGPTGATTDSTPTFTFSSEAGATFECRVDAGTLGACSSPHTTDLLADGGHTFEVQARDAAGNIDTTPASRSFTVDTGAPAITLAGPPARTSATTAELTFSASEAVSGFRCALDAAAPAPCTSPMNLSNVSLGQHTFSVEATDSAGNTGEAAHSWTIVPPPDTTAPLISLAGPPAETTATTAELTFSANEPVTGFRCALDTATLAPCTSPASLSDLSLGQHTFRVEANDNAGNTGSATHVWQVMVAPDTTAPAVTISGPPDPTPGTTATFTFTADENAAFRCSLDSAEFTNCASGVSYSGLSHGPHLFRVEATDDAQNQSVTGYSWTIADSSAPVVTITNGPTSPTTSTTATFQFSANEQVTFRCSLDNGAFAGCASGVSYSGLPVGQHTFEVRAMDGAGNVGSASHSWSVTAAPDTTAPVVTITQAPQSGTSSSTAQFAFTANEAATFRCSLDNGPFADCASGVTYSDLGQGAHLFQVQGRDTAGNVGAANWGWTIASQPPPSCTAQTLNLAANADTWLLESSPTSNYGQDSAIKVDTKAGANARVLVRFALPASVAGCTIADARLRLYAGSYKTGRTLQAVAVGIAWNETAVTWSTQPATTGYAVSAPSGPGYVEWGVGPLLPTSGNAAFQIRDALENGSGVEQGFHSREKGTDNPPVLVVSVH